VIQSNRIDGRFKTSFARHGRRLLPPPLGKMMPPAGLYGIIKHTRGCKWGVRVVLRPAKIFQAFVQVRRVHRDEEDHLLPTTLLSLPPQHPHTRTHTCHAPVPGFDGFKAALPSEIACRGLGMYVVQGGRKKGGVAASSRRVVVSSAGRTNDERWWARARARFGVSRNCCNNHLWVCWGGTRVGGHARFHIHSQIRAGATALRE